MDTHLGEVSYEAPQNGLDTRGNKRLPPGASLCRTMGIKAHERLGVMETLVTIDFAM